jgi:putative endonuclease
MLTLGVLFEFSAARGNSNFPSYMVLPNFSPPVVLLNFRSLLRLYRKTLPCQTLGRMVYHAYMMAGGSGVLYAGISNHLERRVAEHKSRSTRSCTSIYNITKLVYFEPYNDVRDAIAREKQWKNWRRQKKVALIEKQNPTWRDLSEDFNG